VKYVKSLDGLRAAAVLLVILFHVGYLEIGWIGVQVFFVLSGFLITQILLSEKERPLNTYLKRFYWRRSLRIFPLYFGCLVLLTIVFLVTKRLDYFGDQAVYLYTYTYNFSIFSNSWRDNELFDHFWSLSIEEQFYLVWPIVVYLLSSKSLRRLIVILIIVAPIVRLLLPIILIYSNKYTSFLGEVVYLFPLSHADAFATGAAIAVFDLPEQVRKPNIAFFTTAFVIGALGIANLIELRLEGNPTIKLTSFGYPILMIGNLQYIWGYTALNILSAVVIICLLKQIAWLRVFENSYLVGIGKISYGIYIIHRPILYLTQTFIENNFRNLSGIGIFAAYLAIVILLSYISYRWYEQRFLALKDKFFR
jgi:peptidoglycan/LPS O-acetylase OafA/YrhL